MHKFTVLVLAALSLTVAVPAQAEEASIKAQYSDLDLTTPEGIARRNGRNDAAFDRVCGKPSLRVVKAAASQKNCREQTAQTAFSEVARVVEEKNGIALASMLQTRRGG
jgi:UrcA family protein